MSVLSLENIAINTYNAHMKDYILALTIGVYDYRDSYFSGNVWIYNLEEWMVLLPCYKTLKNINFTKRLETATKKWSLKIQF